MELRILVHSRYSHLNFGKFSPNKALKKIESSALGCGELCEPGYVCGWVAFRKVV